jgi:glycosyltransferase involved in cell wall biosynthesis
MRLMYVQTSTRFAGAERQGVMQIRGLADLGYEVIPVVGPGHWVCRELEAVGVHDYVFLPDFLKETDRPLSLPARIAESVRAVPSWTKACQQLYEVARARRVDAIIANVTRGWIVASPVAKRLGVPLLWRCGTRLTTNMQRFGLRVLSTLWRPDALLCNCRALGDEFEPIVGAPTYIVPNGVDTARFDPRRVAPRFRGQRGFGPDTLLVGVAARAVPEKGMDLLAEVLRRTAAEVPEVYLLIAGEGGCREYFEAYFREQGLGDRMAFLGHIDDVEAFYRSCDVVVLTSRARSREASSNALLEAMAMERPVVTTRVGGLAEIVEHGRQGFLVEDGDAATFAGHLIDLFHDPVLRRRMGAAGRATILEHHENLRVVERLSTVLSEVIPGVAAPPLRTLQVNRAPIPRARIQAHGD